eukprot:TRINITY_DN70617_c0_g1_i1.p1 TRINITY_DN70617_c0_g1~~TRINITY_DN70617_c0_g1_i1.p1  ORF type:complete len:542 (+),score=138.58 TRINITY_DN70617_c0_g1_i1:75-1628(+)
MRAAGLCAAALAAGAAGVAPPARPNVLYLMSDDMRPQLGCYGQSEMKTPNLDGLAATGLRFNTAYTQFAYCAPSRNSFLTGRRPERTRCLNFKTDFRKQHGDSWVAMPQYFKNEGYFTSAGGKIYHDGMDDPLSWTYPSNQTQWIECGQGDTAGIHNNFCTITKDSVHPYSDEDLVLEAGLMRMELAVKSGKPWFVAIGTHRPHWPSRLPQGFLGPDVYPDGPGDVVRPPKHPKAITDAPWMSGNWYGGDYHDPAHGCPNCSVPFNRSVEYRRWYYAATTYADYMIGKALKKLDALGATDKTITVFHADHGYQLGELNEWSKKTDTELATRVPLIIRVPWKTASVGQVTEVKAELVDLYRTLAELAGLHGTIQSDVQGTSLAAVFDDPAALPKELAGKRAYSQIGSCACKVYSNHGWTGKECDANRCAGTPVDQFDYMGYSLRTATQRFTAWVPMDANTSRVDWSQPVAHELYLLQDDKGADFDFDGYSLNVAEQDQYKDVVAQFHEELKQEVLSWY